MTAWFAMPMLGDIVFRGRFPFWAAVILASLAAIAVMFIYFREALKLHPIQRIIMALFRAAAIAAIVLLLCKPVMVTKDNATRPRPVAILVDDTQSMNQRDPRAAEADIVRNGIARGVFAPDHPLTLSSGEEEQIPAADRKPTRAEVVMAAFQNPRLNLREELKKKGPLQEFLFGSQVHGASLDWPSHLEPNESKTALLYSISQILQRDDNELPTAIVIATDGIDNDREHKVPWEEIGRECVRLKVPLHIYGVGGGESQFLQLRSLETNPRDTLIADSSVNVVFRWTCKGIKDGNIELNVKLNGRIVASKTVKVKEGDAVSETLTFIPDKKDVTAGKVDLEGSVSLVGGRAEDRDHLTQSVRVVESKVKVLFVENTPRADYMYLKSALQGDRIKGVEANFLLVNADERTKKAGPPYLAAFPNTPKELAAYDMLIIGDVDPAFFSGQQRKMIVDFVDEGGGLVMIAGRQHNPAGYKDNAIGAMLPVEFDVKQFPFDENRKQVEFSPKLADIGRYENLMSLGDTPEENRQIWAKLPGWYWHYPVKKLKPAAQSLLDHPSDTIADPSPLAKDGKRPMPLIARQYYGRGMVLFLAGDSTWRWRFNEDDKYFARFWGQVLYQLGLPHLLGSKTQLIADGEFVKGQPTKVYARLFTSEHRPLELERIEGNLDPAGRMNTEQSEKVMFNPVEGQPGLYVSTIAKDKPGDYTLRLPQGQSASEIVLPVRVTLAAEDETAPGNLNEAALKQLAEQTGGKYYRETI